ncbi:hypothetical protein BgiBS90_001753 [Biomphalaria glabrata]|nr:hypothetical protein BgiBS90_001753 [Biomphalaria glabrata]
MSFSPILCSAHCERNAIKLRGESTSINWPVGVVLGTPDPAADTDWVSAVADSVRAWTPTSQLMRYVVVYVPPLTTIQLVTSRGSFDSRRRGAGCVAAKTPVAHRQSYEKVMNLSDRCPLCIGVSVNLVLT